VRKECSILSSLHKIVSFLPQIGRETHPFGLLYLRNKNPSFAQKSTSRFFKIMSIVRGRKINKGGVMKNHIYLFSITIMLLLSLSGCSDKMQSPVAPIDQQNSVEKAVITNFTFTSFPIAAPVGGTIKLTPGGKWQVKKLEVTDMFASTDPLANGIMKHYLSLTVDAVTGEGPCHGTWTITPSDLAASGGGVWEGTYEGYRSKSNVEGEWTLPLNGVGQGKGGTIAGMQVKSTAILIVRADGPTTLPTSWVATGEGFYKSR